MNKQTSRKMYSTTLHRTETVDDLSIFYREAGDSSNPKIVLLHGFPASSHQYRNLITALAEYFHVVAPLTTLVLETQTCQVQMSSATPSIGSLK